MPEQSARFALPLLVPGQAEKEVYHNEALARIDAALHASVVDGPMADPPPVPTIGQSWIVGSAATGAWAGQDRNLAAWTGGGWRFVAPVPGMMVWQAARGCWVYWTGGGWSDGRLPATSLVIGGVQVVGNRAESISNPTGGTVIDGEVRSAVEAIIATLRSHGLIES